MCVFACVRARVCVRMCARGCACVCARARDPLFKGTRVKELNVAGSPWQHAGVCVCAHARVTPSVRIRASRNSMLRCRSRKMLVCVYVCVCARARVTPYLRIRASRN